MNEEIKDIRTATITQKGQICIPNVARSLAGFKEGTKITTALQVCYELTAKNKEREVQGLLQALRQFHLPIGIILTYDQEEEFKEEHKLIQVIPVWKWLLQE